LTEHDGVIKPLGAWGV